MQRLVREALRTLLEACGWLELQPHAVVYNVAYITANVLPTWPTATHLVGTIVNADDDLHSAISAETVDLGLPVWLVSLDENASPLDAVPLGRVLQQLYISTG